MIQIKGNDPVIDSLLHGDSEAAFILVQLIRKSETALLFTDGRSYLTAQSDFIYPMWIFVNEKADAQTEAELGEILQTALAHNPRLRINAQVGFAEDILRRYAERTGGRFSAGKALNAYTCKALSPVPPVGRLARPEEKCKSDIVRLIKQMSEDIAETMSDEAALKYAEANMGSENLYMWWDGGIVSMAKIADEGPRYARINAVVTEREKRGNGYAKMLVGEVVKNLLARGKIAQLYADAANPCSNRAYQRIGFCKIAELVEYLLER